MRHVAHGLLLAAALLPSCGLMDPGARGRDAGQILQLGLGGSLQPGLYVHALAPLFGASLGYAGHGAYVGSDYGYTFGWHQASYGMLIGGESVRAEFGQSVEGFTDRPLHQVYATQSQALGLNLVVRDERIGKEARAISLRRAEVNVHLLFVGVTVGVDVLEGLDFVAGLFGWDMLDDDARVPRRAPFERTDTDRAGRLRPTEDEAEASDDAPAGDDENPSAADGAGAAPPDDGSGTTP